MGMAIGRRLPVAIPSVASSLAETGARASSTQGMMCSAVQCSAVPCCAVRCACVLGSPSAYDELEAAHHMAGKERVC